MLYLVVVHTAYPPKYQRIAALISLCSYLIYAALPAMQHNTEIFEVKAFLSRKFLSMGTLYYTINTFCLCQCLRHVHSLCHLG